MGNLPTIIPLFPLPNLVLFPGVQIPLHIFEPRYREMVTDLAPGDGGIIGMVMLKGEWGREVLTGGGPEPTDIFDIGCAGRVGGLVKLPDGRFNLVLEGFSEFRVMREIRDRSYRQALVEWRPTQAELLELDEEMLEGLRELLFNYLGAPAQDAWTSLVVQRRLRGLELVNFLCFHLDLSPIEKQTLLEAREARVDRLFDVLMFKLEERKLGPGGTRGGGGTEVVQ